ncbi:hypothetical protein LguiA_001055 [Lonicera macranthoides]
MIMPMLIVDLPTYMAISPTFNVAYLYEYYPLSDLDASNLRTSSFQVGEIGVEHVAEAYLAILNHHKPTRPKK